MENLIVNYNFNLESNMEEIKLQIGSDIKEKYDVIITDDSVKEAKELMAELNKGKKEFNETCKNFLDEVLSPITMFKTQQKEISSLFDDAREKLKVQVDKFEKFKFDEIRNIVEKYRDELCSLKNINNELIVVNDLVLLGSVTSKMKLTKKTTETIDARISIVENEILKAKIEQQQKDEEERLKQEEIKKEAEEKFQKEKEELIRQNEKEKQEILNAVKMNKEPESIHTTPFDEPMIKKEPTNKIVNLSFEFNVTGTPTDEQILDRVKSQISEQFMKFLVKCEVM